MTGLSGLNAAPLAAKDAGALRQAARQLEAVFVNLMFEEMAKTVQDSPLLPKAPGSDMYQQWFRGAVAEQWTAHGGTGLGDQIAASLGEGASVSDMRLALARASGRPGGAAADRLGVPAPVAARSERPLGQTVSWPVPGRVTSAFGHRDHPVHGGRDHHRGVDIAAPVGTPVRVPFAGRVAEVGENDRLGRFVIIEHEHGYRSLFGHLDAAQVEVGTPVRRGAVVATSGNTGRTTGPHVHYGLYRDGRAVDPTPHLR